MAHKMAKVTTKKRRKTSTAHTRHHDWQTPFLNNLSRNGIILEACQAAKISRTTYYEHYKADREFARLADLALEEAGDVLEAEARRRAIVEKSDTLLIFLLKGIKPEKFRETREVTGPNGGPVLFSEIVAVLQPEAADDHAGEPVAD